MTQHIVIVGSALSGNKGAASMLEAALAGLVERMPEARFTLLSMYPREDAALNSYSTLEVVDARPLTLGVTINFCALAYAMFPPLRPLLRCQPAIAALARADVLLDQGGITFADGREKFLLYNIASILPALLMGVPVFKCAQAMGPFANPINRAAALALLPRARCIITRGAITHGHVQGLGLANFEAGADLAFTLDHSAARAPKELALPPGEGALVGLAPSVVMQKKIEAMGRDYVRETAAFADYCVARGLRVVLIPHSARTGTDKTHNNDLPLCRAVYAAMTGATCTASAFFDREVDARSLRRLIATCDVFVTSRFHAMVSGLATATPTLVIGWSHKYEEVLEMFGMQRWALAHADYSPQRLEARFEELLVERASVARQLAAKLPEVRARAAVQLDRIAQIVGSEA
ncbi:polysaccharide pyruvyl transferase family protein [Erythrobacter vulgaris]|uniref:Polysaccharide pyruvyl transferase family protein n=1 Tax=Qipengyuania vulgaris TaxID=291985 RepID=A0A844XVN9_9SPHN|nr:polysaccharide pyruvyl transferase family protein [Qipengyuania vulgaris]MXO49419.1 polysaccharide pyruvyl transferase family protein [Qipengyuania vulgaris]